MRVFNRIFMILLLAGLFVLGVYAVVYGFDLFGYSLGDLSKPLDSLGNNVENFVQTVESGNVPPLSVLFLVLVAILGLILFIAELKPPAPRRVRMQKGTYITRDVVKREVESAADRVLGVLGATSRVRARRRPGAQVDLEARVRRGEDTKAIGSELRSSVQERLAKRGIPVNKVNVKLVEVDPRQTTVARVQ